MHQRDFLMSVRVGDTVYINSRSKRYCGRSGVVTAKEHRRAKVRLNDHIEQWFSFYTISREHIEKFDDEYLFANAIGNTVACPHCKRVLFDYKNTILDIEAAHGMCKFCHTKVKWDLREARKKAEEY